MLGVWGGAGSGNGSEGVVARRVERVAGNFERGRCSTTYANNRGLEEA